MASIKQRNDPVRLLWRRLTILALLVCVIVGIFGVLRAFREDQESLALRNDAASQLADLKTRQAELNADIATLDTTRGKEAMLRQQYALAAQGEGMIIIVNPTTTPEQATSSSTFIDWLHKTFPWW